MPDARGFPCPELGESDPFLGRSVVISLLVLSRLLRLVRIVNAHGHDGCGYGCGRLQIRDIPVMLVMLKIGQPSVGALTSLSQRVTGAYMAAVSGTPLGRYLGA